MKRFMLIISCIVFLLFSCGTEGNTSVETTAQQIPPEEQLIPVDLPFDVYSYTPEGDEYTVTFAPGQNVLFYYWMPLIRQEESESDIMYLVELIDSSLVVIPVQLDPSSRNQAQRIINEMNIGLAVCQTDPMFYDRYGSGELPITVYIVPGEEPVVETGFGSPQRILDSSEE